MNTTTLVYIIVCIVFAIFSIRFIIADNFGKNDKPVKSDHTPVKKKTKYILGGLVVCILIVIGYYSIPQEQRIIKTIFPTNELSLSEQYDNLKFNLTLKYGTPLQEYKDTVDWKNILNYTTWVYNDTTYTLLTLTETNTIILSTQFDYIPILTLFD
jgi:hypothetical protein